MKHTILFTGHMIDAEGRTNPRFPPDLESTVREEMRKKLVTEMESLKNEIKGITGGASGGDILFHELCAELNIPTEMYLALPVEEFKKASVSFAGKDWEKRFDSLVKKLPVQILSGINNNNENVWERANNWMLNTALENGGENMSLIALWDGKDGDGNGGTEHMVEMAKLKGGTINIIRLNKI